MASEVFVDTGAWVALADEQDSYHGYAVTAYPRVRREWRSWLTTNLVVAEAYTLSHRRLGHRAAIAFLTTVRNETRLVTIYSDLVLETTADEILRRYADQDFSYTDAVSFALMRQRGISAAFAFDRHFLTAGFSLVPAAPR